MAGAVPDVSEIVPAAMRSASIGSIAARAHSRSSATVAGARPRSAARSARNASSCRADGRSPCHSSHVISSNVALPAISPTGKPAMTSSPRSPSTSLNRVSAATTPSSPLFTAMGSTVACCMILSMLIDKSMWVDAGDASRLLGVTRATLYAYVSRGLIRSQPAGVSAASARTGGSRERRYAREDLERLRRRVEARRNPEAAAAGALQWGVPVLESAIACIDGARLYYRGHDAIELARTRTVADVASLIWT